MNALVELIKKIGIFMVVAQAVIHFAPEHKYEKYIKLVVGIMVLLQFLSPLYKISGGTQPDWSALLSDMGPEADTEGLLGEISAVPSIEDTLIANIEQEIKSKLNDALVDENYRVVNVVVHLRTQNQTAGYGTGDDGGNGTNRYTLDTVRVAVQAHSGNTYQETDAIKIQKITLDGSVEDKQSEARTNNRQDPEETLRRKFCEILGMKEESMEVSVYGTMEETD